MFTAALEVEASSLRGLSNLSDITRGGLSDQRHAVHGENDQMHDHKQTPFLTHQSSRLSRLKYILVFRDFSGQGAMADGWHVE